jgi:hypothetical protein
MQLRRSRFRTEKIGSPDLGSGRAKSKCGSYAASVWDPARSYHRHTDSIDDLRP